MYRIKYYQWPQAEKQFYNLIQLFVSFLVFNLEVLFTTHCTTMQSDTFRAFNLAPTLTMCYLQCQVRSLFLHKRVINVTFFFFFTKMGQIFLISK